MIIPSSIKFSNLYSPIKTDYLFIEFYESDMLFDFFCVFFIDFLFALCFDLSSAI